MTIKQMIEGIKKQERLQKDFAIAMKWLKNIEAKKGKKEENEIICLKCYDCDQAKGTKNCKGEIIRPSKKVEMQVKRKIAKIWGIDIKLFNKKGGK